MITLQYLEPGPHIAQLSVTEAAEKLCEALDLLPIDVILLGWDIPQVFEDTCRDILSQRETKLYRWHPLLTGDGVIHPEEKWRTKNVKGHPLPGFRNLPEFTFICPHNPEARTAILTHITKICKSGRYEGIFLDRMRFPSPATDPFNTLACFCDHCRRSMGAFGLDAEEVRKAIESASKENLVSAIFGASIQTLSAFLNFRQQTISRFIDEVVAIIRSHGLEVGLDCFSPSLTCMVGQDLTTLAPLADWTKIMVYGHALGPATLPFEFEEMAKWFMAQDEWGEADVLQQLSEITGLSLPKSLAALSQFGFPPEFLSAEVNFGREMAGSSQLLAGIELVEMPGVSELNDAQIEADLRAFQAAGADGLSISWDLLHIPLERLELVNSVWF